MSLMRLSRDTSWVVFVTPATGPTLQARARFRLLIMLLFPTLGYPANS